jgi:hypothetical protein
MTVQQAFHDFLGRLELTATEEDKVSRQQSDLRERVRQQFRGIQRDVLVGSYSRKTAVRPLNDVDVFLVLDPAVHGARKYSEPLLILEDLQRALRGCYPSPGPATRIQGRSVNVEFSGTGIGYDIIPAFFHSMQGTLPTDVVYEIPDRNRRTWIRTNPERHRQRCVEANQRAGGMLNRIIKAAKHWNRSQKDARGEKPWRSFHLESLAYGAFRSPPGSERAGLAALLNHLVASASSSCPDPAGLGPSVDSDIDWGARQRAQQLTQSAASLAADAMAQERYGDHAAAAGRWRQLLGSEFRA